MLNVHTAGALTGIRVIDLSRVLGGPYATQVLGDHGADVVKVEPPGGDETREWGPPFRDDDGARGPSAYYLNVNRNKRGIALDLRKADGRAALLRLLEDADVLVENFKAGTLEKWDLGFEAVLAPMFPRLVHCRISGFGSEGPYGGFPGYDAVVQTMTGLSSVTGSPASGPVKMGTPVIDIASGLNAVIGILLALRERERTGKGQSVEVALYDVGLSLLHPHSANWLWGHKMPSLIGNAHPNVVPYDLFQTATRPVFLGVGNDGQVKKAFAVLGIPELWDDARFNTMAARNANRVELTAILAPIFARHDGVQLAQTLLEAGVPAGPLNNVQEALDDPQTAAREMRIETAGYKGMGSPIKLSETPPSLRRLPPDFGHDTDGVLSEAGFSESDIKQLREGGAIPEK
ncbi:Acetyl-CoA:oxalate CoA-transferase [Alphaproteobacteria bacterium SO-S41]|nr:Acetyl-CoA:oxalate CoA-transferase [Alphaproteobacteria bacterium SO-S41]